MTLSSHNSQTRQLVIRIIRTAGLTCQILSSAHSSGFQYDLPFSRYARDKTPRSQFLLFSLSTLPDFGIVRVGKLKYKSMGGRGLVVLSGLFAILAAVIGAIVGAFNPQVRSFVIGPDKPTLTSVPQVSVILPSNIVGWQTTDAGYNLGGPELERVTRTRFNLTIEGLLTSETPIPPTNEKTVAFRAVLHQTLEFNVLKVVDGNAEIVERNFKEISADYSLWDIHGKLIDHGTKPLTGNGVTVLNEWNSAAQSWTVSMSRSVPQVGTRLTDEELTWLKSLPFIMRQSQASLQPVVRHVGETWAGVVPPLTFSGMIQEWKGDVTPRFKLVGIEGKYGQECAIISDTSDIHADMLLKSGVKLRVDGVVGGLSCFGLRDRVTLNSDSQGAIRIKARDIPFHDQKVSCEIDAKIRVDGSAEVIQQQSSASP